MQGLYKGIHCSRALIGRYNGYAACVTHFIRRALCNYAFYTQPSQGLNVITAAAHNENNTHHRLFLQAYLRCSVLK